MSHECSGLLYDVVGAFCTADDGHISHVELYYTSYEAWYRGVTTPRSHVRCSDRCSIVPLTWQSSAAAAY
jgi:hypothetical protein